MSDRTSPQAGDGETHWAEQVAELAVAQGTFGLGRRAAGKAPVRAWDAADEYALNHVAELGLDDPILVVNDGFGALTTALIGSRRVVSFGDSVAGFDSTRRNLVRNGLATDRYETVASHEPFTDAPASIDVAIVKVPKTLALLDYQLRAIRPMLHADSVIIGAGMTRHVHASTIEIFDVVFGTTTTSLAKKKARLIHSSLTRDNPEDPGQAFDSGSYSYVGIELTTAAGVFSQRRLDQGTRLLADYLTNDEPARAAAADSGDDDSGGDDDDDDDGGGAASDRAAVPERIVDLGCGNGVLGIAAAAAYPSAQIDFVDVSYLAVESARTNWRTFASSQPATFVASDGLSGAEPGTADLVVNNPPFHEGNSVGDDIAWRMFGDAQRALRPGGTLLVVGNRHLGYHTKLKRRFGNCETVASDKKFVVLRAKR